MKLPMVKEIILGTLKFKIARIRYMFPSECGVSNMRNKAIMHYHSTSFEISNPSFWNGEYPQVPPGVDGNIEWAQQTTVSFFSWFYLYIFF